MKQKLILSSIYVLLAICFLTTNIFIIHAFMDANWSFSLPMDFSDIRCKEIYEKIGIEEYLQAKNNKIYVIIFSLIFASSSTILIYLLHKKTKNNQKEINEFIKQSCLIGLVFLFCTLSYALYYTQTNSSLFEKYKERVSACERV